MSEDSKSTIAIDKQRLEELLEENRLYKELHSQNEAPNVVIHVASYAPQIVVDIDRDESVVLEPNSRMKSIAVSYPLYLKLKRETDWFDKGLLYSDQKEDTNGDNPNLILDIGEWVVSRTEAQVRKDIKLIDSVGPLNALYEHTEAILFRDTDLRRKTGKVRLVRQLTMDRLSELQDCSLIEDSPE